MVGAHFWFLSMLANANADEWSEFYVVDSKEKRTENAETETDGIKKLQSPSNYFDYGGPPSLLTVVTTYSQALSLWSLSIVVKPSAREPGCRPWRWKFFIDPGADSEPVRPLTCPGYADGTGGGGEWSVGLLSRESNVRTREREVNEQEERKLTWRAGSPRPSSQRNCWGISGGPGLTPGSGGIPGLPPLPHPAPPLSWLRSPSCPFGSSCDFSRVPERARCPHAIWTARVGRGRAAQRGRSMC